MWKVIVGDSLEVMRGMPSGSIDLCMTSPPYADARAHTYGGESPDRYCDWFIPYAVEIKRLLKPSGSFVLNIKQGTKDGQRHLFVHRLVIALVEEVGFRLPDEYIWYKPNSRPGFWPHRFRDAWEYLFHFAVSKDLWIDRDAVKVKAAENSVAKGKREREKRDAIGGRRVTTGTDSGFDTWLAIDYGPDGLCYPDNVLVETVIRDADLTHSAQYPLAIPTFFVRLLCPPGGTVLDPFVGSGTTLEAAWKQGREGIGIDVDPKAAGWLRQRLGMFAEVGNKPVGASDGAKPPEAKESGLEPAFRSQGVDSQAVSPAPVVDGAEGVG